MQLLHRTGTPLFGGALGMLAVLFPASATVAAEPETGREARWQPLSVVDVHAFPDDEQPRFNSQSKSIWRGPGGSSLIWARFKPTFDDEPPLRGLGPHYHHFHEWALVLEGDYVIHEPVSPRQQGGPLYQFVEGTWLDRPAYSIHGGSWALGGMRSQMPCTLLIFEEGDGSVVTLGPDGDHFKPDFPEKPENYDPDWEAVPAFTHPWIVHSGSQLEWERDPEDPGRWLKWLSDDPAQGFRARLVKVPPGWTAESASTPAFYEKANTFMYVTWGDLRIQTFEDNGEADRLVHAGADWFIHQPPRALMSHGNGAATDGGAIWLEVTYADGTSVGGGPIETRKFLE